MASEVLRKKFPKLTERQLAQLWGYSMFATRHNRIATAAG